MVGARIERAVGEVYPREFITVCNSMAEAVAMPVFQSINHEKMIVIAEDKGELASFTAYLSSLLERKIVLILPDMETDTLSMGCMFHPIYMSDIAGDMGDLQKVVTKMAGGRGLPDQP